MLKVLKLRDVFGSPKPSKNFFLKVLVKVFGEGFFLRDNLIGVLELSVFQFKLEKGPKKAAYLHELNMN